MNFTAAPIIRQPQDVIGAPGKTDFVHIFLAEELNGREYRTTLRHEQAHVWARHNCRRPLQVDAKLWIIACEMEIARTIYDDIDLDTIMTPRSRLAGGYLPDSIQELPNDVVLAEDIYAWLLQNPDVKCTSEPCSCDMHIMDEDGSEKVESPSQLIASAREALDDIEVKSSAQNKISKSMEDIARRPPSLIEAVDAALRVRIERERSYRRPSRRENHGGLLYVGAISTPRPPLVEIFIDRSGSFSPEKTREAEQSLELLLRRYKASIRQDVWFFGDGRLSSTDIPGGGNTPYGLIVNHVIQSSPKMIIVITDDDPVGDLVTSRIPKNVSILCVPIGCAHTQLARALGGVDVTR